MASVERFPRVLSMNICFHNRHNYWEFTTQQSHIRDPGVTLQLIIEVWNTAQNALQQEWGNFPFANWNGICWGLPLQLVQLIKIHFLPHLESFMWERKFEKKFFKKSPIQPLIGCSLFSNSHFQMGDTVMGFAEHFGHNQTDTDESN